MAYSETLGLRSQVLFLVTLEKVSRGVRYTNLSWEVAYSCEMVLVTEFDATVGKAWRVPWLARLSYIAHDSGGTYSQGGGMLSLRGPPMTVNCVMMKYPW